MTRPLLDDDFFVVGTGNHLLPPFMRPVVLGAGTGEATGLGEGHPDLAGREALLGDHATHFALARRLRAEHDEGHPLPPSIALGGAGLFAVTRPLDPAGTTWERLASLTESDFRAGPGTLVLPGVVTVPGVLVHGAAEHPLQDLLRFTAVAIDCDVVEQGVVAGFLPHRTVVPEPTVGVYPTDWYLQCMADLERVTTTFLDRTDTGHDRRPGSLAFCVGRLHSMLLANLIADRPDLGVVEHPPLVVLPDDAAAGTG